MQPTKQAALAARDTAIVNLLDKLGRARPLEPDESKMLAATLHRLGGKRETWHWSAADDAAIRELLAKRAKRKRKTKPFNSSTEVRELADRLGRSYMAVHRRMERLRKGLVAEPEPVQKNVQTRTCNGTPTRPGMATKVSTIKIVSSNDSAPPPRLDKRGRPAPPIKKAWVPTKKDRQTVELAVAAGMSQEQIAGIMGVSVPTLRKHFRVELETGAAKVNAKIAGKLFDKCMKGDSIALIFWAKTRLCWNEKQLLEHTGKDGGPIVYEQIEAEAAAFTDRIAKMAEKFAIANDPLPPPDELTQKSTEGASQC